MIQKNGILGALGVIGGMIATLFGGWDASIVTLIIFMAVDYVSGLVCAGIFRASAKTEGGGLSSKVGFVGIAKKCMMMLFVLVGARLDILLELSIIRDGVCIAFIINEVISIIENAGLMGLPVPRVIRDAVELLRERSDSDTDGHDGK